MNLPLLVELSSAVTFVANVAWWAAAQAGTGYAAHRLPPRALGRDGALLRVRPWERALYRGVRVRRWKDRLPEAGAVFEGGISKRHLPETLDLFVRETRRAELAHWWSAACGPVAILWNPAAGAILMITYGVVVNAPFIAIQRYNRGRVQRLQAGRARRTCPT